MGFRILWKFKTVPAHPPFRLRVIHHMNLNSTSSGAAFVAVMQECNRPGVGRHGRRRIE